MNTTFNQFRTAAEQLALDFAARNQLPETDICMDDLIENFLELAYAQIEAA